MIAPIYPGQAAMVKAMAQQARPRPRINGMPNGKKGYRVFLGKAYLGYYRFTKDAEKCARESPAVLKIFHLSIIEVAPSYL